MLPLGLCCLLAAPGPLTPAADGDETHAAWSPDGRRVVYCRERRDDLDLVVLDLASGERTVLVGGPGDAAFPAWSPDGQWVVYTFSQFTGTAAERPDEGYHLFAAPAAGGEPRRLTSGRFRDYTAAWSRDSGTLLFTSTRGVTGGGTGIWTLPASALTAAEPVEPRPLVPCPGEDVAVVGPDLSPDGRLLAYAEAAGIRGNWRLVVARRDEPARRLPLTDPDGAFHGPRWSPDGRRLACTGYLAGDPGWGLYLFDPATGGRLRLETGAGNARRPAWSPDGRELVYERQVDGVYRLHRLAAPETIPAPAETSGTADRRGPILAWRFDGEVTGLTVTGEPRAEGGAWYFGPGQYASLAAPEGLAFGRGAFSVRARVRLDEATGQLRHLVMGQYPGNPLGWQLFIRENGQAMFHSRDDRLTFLGAGSDGPLPLGREVTLVGIRRATGGVRLYLDGILQGGSAVGATVAYPTPVQLRIGSTYNGANPLNGWLSSVEIFDRELLPDELERPSLAELLAGP